MFYGFFFFWTCKVIHALLQLALWRIRSWPVHTQNSCYWCNNILKFDNCIVLSFLWSTICEPFNMHSIQLLPLPVFLYSAPKDLLLVLMPALSWFQLFPFYEVRRIWLWQTYQVMSLPACTLGNLLSWQFWSLEGLYCKFWLVLSPVGCLWMIHS